MPYLVIDSDRKIISGGILPTQAAANTLAATDSGWTAHSGEVTGSDFHANAEPGWFLTTAGVTVIALPLSALQELKNEMNIAHHYLVGLQADLHHEGSGRPWTEVIKVHDYFARVHQSNFQIVHENPNDLTVAQRMVYATALLAGPQDGSNVRLTISELFNAVSNSQYTVGLIYGVTYVNPSDGVQLTINLSLHTTSLREGRGLGSAGSPLVVTETQLISGLWTEGITVNTTGN